MDYIRTNVIKKRIIKPKDKAESITFFNYPYQAIEEAVVNALYHRDYQEREPVEITIEPKKISILSYAGPDRSISLDAIHKAEHLKSRRYRNRRLGDYLKELQLSEGRATGIPTIQDELRRNGSEPARIETDEDRTYFLIEIPCREGFENAREPLNDAINDMTSNTTIGFQNMIKEANEYNNALKNAQATLKDIGISSINSNLGYDTSAMTKATTNNNYTNTYNINVEASGLDEQTVSKMILDEIKEYDKTLKI